MIQTHRLGFDQGALLAACLNRDSVAEIDRMVPVALTLSKADLLPQATSLPLAFLAPADPAHESIDELIRRIKDTSSEVAAFLEGSGAHTLLGPARLYEQQCQDARKTSNGRGLVGTVTYHAVSALGSAPNQQGALTADVAPLNCVDPLAAVLSQIARVW